MGISLDRRRLVEWQKTGKIERIANNWYWFEENQPNESDLFYLANKIYSPSYISLETALSYYGMIPEQSFTIQSVSTRKTKQLTWRNHHFVWQSVQNRFYVDYKLIFLGKIHLCIASPEKALLDLIYLRKDLRNKADIESLRLNENFMKTTFNWDNAQRLIAFLENKPIKQTFDHIEELYRD
jgi:predicted transcriptional regulator of viral defense system